MMKNDEKKKKRFIDEEKRFIGKWWIWFLFLIVISTIVVSGLSYVGIFGKTIIERKVFENSYQKKESDKSAVSTYDAQLRMLRNRLNNPSNDGSTRNEIQGQIDAIIIMKASKTD